jgi:hypothetical protein
MEGDHPPGEAILIQPEEIRPLEVGRLPLIRQPLPLPKGDDPVDLDPLAKCQP